MNENQKEELRAWQDQARSALRQEADRLEEKSRQINGLMRVMEATEELFSENRHLEDELERRQEEIDDLNEQLEQKEQEIDDLRRQLLEARNQHLEAENQHLEAEVHAKPLEIHNHFESGSNSQVFNDKVNGKFIRKQNDKKKNKKRWKKIVRKML